jgi:alpha-tubulin suppressor-like RCC1 family protein
MARPVKLDALCGLPFVIAALAGCGPGSPAIALSAGEQEHACAVLDTGGLKCWGGNAFGQLGDGTTTARDAPVSINCE